MERLIDALAEGPGASIHFAMGRLAELSRHMKSALKRRTGPGREIIHTVVQRIEMEPI